MQNTTAATCRSKWLCSLESCEYVDMLKQYALDRTTQWAIIRFEHLAEALQITDLEAFIAENM